MAKQMLERCCRNCVHRGWGKTKRYQQHDSIVCLLKPKVFKNAIDNIEPHYYAAKMIECCDNFERRTDK